MTHPSPGTPAGVSLPARVFFFVAGLLALVVGILITLGAALAGALSIAGAAFMYSRRGRRLTRRGAWVSSVVGTIGVLVILIGLVTLTSETSRRPMTAAERADARARTNEALPEWLKAFNPGAQSRTAAADSMANRLLENRAVVVWAGLMGAVLSSTLIGTIAGSFAWGGVMLLYRGFKGDWMPSTADPETGVA